MSDDAEAIGRMLVECAPDAIVVIDERGLILQCNPAAAEFFGYSAGDLLGRNVRMLMPSPQHEEHDGYLQRYLASGEPRIIGLGRDVQGRRKDGTLVPIHLKVAELFLPDGTRRFVGFMRDVSERMRVLAELEDHRHHLEALVTQRTTELTQAHQQAVHLAKVKSDFLANMSHEIRTPLHAIVGMTHLLQASNPTPLQAEKLGWIAVSAEHLLSIVSDVLDITKIDAGKLEVEHTAFRLSQVCDTVDHLIRHGAEAKGLALALDCPRRLVEMDLVGDPNRLAQVLVNLGGNAVKFTKRGSVILRASMMSESSHDIQLRFEVIDTGIGIEEQALPRLFSEFEQADNSTTRKYGGTGLGLAICKRLLELMDSRIDVDSRVGVGSNFHFTLRFGKASHAPRPAANDGSNADLGAILTARHAGARILLVEDDAVNQMIATELLRARGLVVDLASDGLEALAMAEAAPYDLILMDIQMPRMNGVDAARRIRARPNERKVPILAMTANAFSEDRQRCLEAGMDDFLPKPVVPRQLYAALLRHL